MGTELKKNSRFDVMDAIKAVAIISVICGHSCAVLPYSHLRIGRFVQLYHIMAFFFVSGYCFNEKKYENNISLLMGSRLTKIVGLYFCYNAFFVCIHNLLSRLYLISDPLYSRNEILYHILSGLVFDTAEVLICPFWFLPVLVFALLLLGLIFKLSAMVRRKYHLDFLCRVIEILCAGGCGLYDVHRLADQKLRQIHKRTYPPCGIYPFRTSSLLSDQDNTFRSFRECTGKSRSTFLSDHDAGYLFLLQSGHMYLFPQDHPQSFLLYREKQLPLYGASPSKIIDYVYSLIMNKPAETRVGFTNAYNLGEILIVLSILLVTLYVLGKDSVLRLIKKQPQRSSGKADK